MALRESFMVKNGVAVTTLTLQPEMGQSIRVLDILCMGVSGGYLTIKVERKTVGYFRVDSGTLGNHLEFPGQLHPRKTILGLLRELGIFKGYPLAEGETMELSGLGTTAMTASILYELYDAGDVKATEQSGTKSDNYLFLNYGRVAAVVSTAGDTLYSTSKNPSEFPAFPFGATCPANKRILIHALLASERAGDDGTTAANYAKTTYYKMLREREVLHDEDRNGIIALGATVGTGGTFEAGNGQGRMGDFSTVCERLPLLFLPPIVAVSNEEVLTYVSTIVAATAGTLTVAELEIALVVEVLPIRV